MRVGVVVWVLSWCVAAGCAGIDARVRRAPQTECATLLREYPEISSDSAYGELLRSEREPYEGEVASCLLVARKPNEARDLARSWHEVEPNRYAISALAAAQLGDVRAVESELEQLAEVGGPVGAGIYFAKEFEPFAAQEWFVGAAARGHNPGQGTSFERHVEHLLEHVGTRLLPLRVATADLSRPAGDWVLWLGVVHQGRLDRERQRTLLFAEGAEVVVRPKTRRERRVEAAQEPPRWYGASAWVGTAQARPSTAESGLPEELVPIGQRFVVEFGAVSEYVAGLRAAYVLGRFQGRDPETQQVLVHAVLVQPRTPRTTTETTAR